MRHLHKQLDGLNKAQCIERLTITAGTHCSLPHISRRETAAPGLKVLELLFIIKLLPFAF